MSASLPNCVRIGLPIAVLAAFVGSAAGQVQPLRTLEDLQRLQRMAAAGKPIDTQGYCCPLGETISSTMEVETSFEVRHHRCLEAPSTVDATAIASIVVLQSGCYLCGSNCYYVNATTDSDVVNLLTEGSWSVSVDDSSNCSASLLGEPSAFASASGYSTTVPPCGCDFLRGSSSSTSESKFTYFPLQIHCHAGTEIYRKGSLTELGLAAASAGNKVKLNYADGSDACSFRYLAAASVSFSRAVWQTKGPCVCTSPICQEKCEDVCTAVEILIPKPTALKLVRVRAAAPGASPLVANALLVTYTDQTIRTRGFFGDINNDPIPVNGLTLNESFEYTPSSPSSFEAEISEDTFSELNGDTNGDGKPCLIERLELIGLLGTTISDADYTARLDLDLDGDIDIDDLLLFNGLPCNADWDCNGLINSNDYVLFQQAWAGQDPAADLNGDSLFNISDFNAFSAAAAVGCP